MKSKYDFFQTLHLQQLLNNIQSEGYLGIGQQVRDGAIIYDAITSIEQLPYGITDTQAPGKYSLSTSTSAKYFDWANGPQAYGTAHNQLMELSHLKPQTPISNHSPLSVPGPVILLP